MKPPRTGTQFIPQANETKRVTRQSMNGQRILAAQAFTHQSEYAHPAVRAVWSAIDSCVIEKEDKRRRKKR